MCSVIEIKTANEYYIHYHTIDSDNNDKQLSDISENSEETNDTLENKHIDEDKSVTTKISIITYNCDVNDDNNTVDKVKTVSEHELPVTAEVNNGEEEDRGTGYNFGKKWSYLPG